MGERKQSRTVFYYVSILLRQHVDIVKTYNIAAKYLFKKIKSGVLITLSISQMQSEVQQKKYAKVVCEVDWN